jgi:formamidopyrimidine-DNA glycosylase
MPELPEVEIAKRSLARWLTGRRVVRAQAPATRIFRDARRSEFQALRGKLRTVGRRGKYLLFEFERGQGLLAHLGMTGKFVRRPPGAAEPHSRARLELDSGETIHFLDPRMFGSLRPGAPRELVQRPPWVRLGRDPLEDGLSATQLREALVQTRQPVKVALMDQSRVAGLGNLYAAEALFRAGLHPGRLPGTLGPAEWRRLARGIHAALRFGLATQRRAEVRYLAEGGEQQNPFFVYDRRGEPCRRCGQPIRAFTQAGRTTYWCPRCQPLRPRGRQRTRSSR